MSRFQLPAIQPLERRVLFNTFVVNGTEGNDVITIMVEKGLITVSVNGQDFLAGDAITDVIDVRGLGGDDWITLFNSGDNDILLSGDNADGSGFGHDTIDIAAGNLDRVGAPVTVSGGGGDDLVRLNDHNNLFGDPVTITSALATRVFFGGLSYGTDLEGLVWRGSRGNGNFEVQSTSAATRVSLDAGDGKDIVVVHQTHFNSPLTILPASGDDDILIGNATVIFDATQRIGGLSLSPGSLARIAPDGDTVLILSILEMSDGSILDLTDNAAILDYTKSSPLTMVQSRLAMAYGGGTWSVPGITSSVAASASNTAVGFAEASDLFSSFPATFSGQSIDSTAILLKYTFYGDADLTGNVNLNDFNRLATNFGQSPRRWVHGNFDFDNDVDLMDFNRLAGNFGSSGLRLDPGGWPATHADDADDLTELLL